jgi:hypothetical protein
LALHGAAELSLPLIDKSVRVAVIVNRGPGQEPEFEVAHQMTEVHSLFPFDFALMLGDNIYDPRREVRFPLV